MGLDARILAIGSELLGDRRDTNGPEIARRLALRGVRIARLEAVPDVPSLLHAALGEAVEAAQLVVACGGLGPTDDDLTRDAAAAVAGVPLVEDARTLECIRSRATIVNDSTRRQALVPEGARVIDNPVGHAPGSVLVLPRSVLLLLPGPPGELLPMLDDALDAALAAVETAGLGRPDAPLRHAVLRVTGMGESVVGERLAGLDPAVRISWLPVPGEVEVHLRCADAAVLEAARDDAARRLGAHVHSVDGSTLAEGIVRVLAERFETVTAAESCTGGLLAAALTSVPGSSEVFRASVVTYADEAKVELLGVDPSILEAHGAVSAECVEAMASGARRLARSDWALSVSGIAGPGGGSDEKPVGLVHVGLAHPDGRVESRRIQFPGSREDVRARSVTAALDLLRRRLHAIPEAPRMP